MACTGFRFCSEVQKTNCYLGYYGQLEVLCRNNEQFQSSINAFSSQFLRRKPERQEHEHRHLQMSRQYLLEELAVICCLAQDVPCAFIYPGSLTILKEI